MKPQFEPPAAEVGAAGSCVTAPLAPAVEAVPHGSRAPVGLGGVMASPLRGPAGNVEFFVRGRRGAPHVPPDLQAALVEGVALARAPLRSSSHEGRPAAVDAAAELRAALVASGVELASEDGEGPDLVVAVGGDGTFLRAAHPRRRGGAPLLGVKVGRMGFLTEAEPAEAIALIRAALEDSAETEERLSVVAEPTEGSAFPPQWAMNEVMVEKRARHRLVRLRMEVDGATSPPSPPTASSWPPRPARPPTRSPREARS